MEKCAAKVRKNPEPPTHSSGIFIKKGNRRRHAAKSVTLFYELSSCDLYIRSKIIDGTVPLKDIIGLSIGLKLQTL